MREIISLALMIIGTLLMVIAGIGIVRMPDLFLRMSAATKASTLGAGFCLLAVVVYFGELGASSRAIAIIIFLLLTAPVAAHMIGRAAYRTPMILADLAAPVFGREVPGRLQIAGAMADYADRRTAEGVPLHAITRHMLGLYHGQRGARLWRRHLGEEARNRRDSGALIRQVAAACEEMAARLAA